MILKAPVAILLFFSGSIFKAQDSLVFCLKKNETKEVKIPIVKFNIKIKTSTGKKYNVRILSFQDSAFQVRIKKTTAAGRKELKELFATADTTKYPAAFSDAQYDSVLKRTTAREIEIQYPELMTIALKDIRKIKINNNNRPEKKKLMKVMKVAPFILVPSLFIAPLSENIYVIAPVYAVTGVWAISAMILQTKTLNMKKKWKLKRVVG
jgi:hypothetical protein